MIGWMKGFARGARGGLGLAAALVVLAGACAPAPRADPALWRIADEDSEIWLFGSVHLLAPDVEWRSARLDAAFAGADEVVFETDASEAGAPALRAEAAARGRLPEGERLSARLDAETQAALVRVARAYGLDPAQLEGLRPWLAALTVSLAAAVKMGATQEAGVETVLLAEAQASGKTVSHLESAEEQIRTLSDLSEADEVRFLAASLRQIEEEPESSDALDAAWATGDAERLHALAREQIMEAGPAVYDALITRRNARWAEEIARRLEGEGRIFVAVGAAHMGGQDGLVALLRARGIEVETVN